jgi:hypothetical protein
LNLEASKLEAVYDLGKPESIKPTSRAALLGAMEKRVRVRLEDEETSGGVKGHKLEDQTRAFERITSPSSHFWRLVKSK